MYDTIIEPFAGSARYSLCGDNWKRNVILVDKYPVIVDLWRWLQLQSEDSILSLPDVKRGDDISQMDIDPTAKILMGFCINPGSATPKNIVADFCSWRSDKLRISRSLFKIREWDIRLGSFDQIENINATWFIDPPYYNGGQFYKNSSSDLDYQLLSDWCRSRNGQIIVCENTLADWMSFSPLKRMHGSRHTTTEAMWTNIPQTSQETMF